MVNDLKLENCKTVTTPGTSTEGRTAEDCKELLPPYDESKYRALVARANYISPDRPDVSFAVKELAKSMAKPTRGD